MPEGLLSRIGRLVSGSANALVESLENAAPEVVLAESIREIDVAIKDVKEQLGKAEAAKYLASKSLNTENVKHNTLAEQINDALAANRDDLAEAAIAKQMDIEAMIPVIEKAVIDADSDITELASFVSALEAKKREMQEALSDLIKSQKHATATEAHSSSDNVNNRVDNAESAFNRIMANQGVPANQSNADEKKLAELNELSRQNRIKERLAKAKTSLSDA